MSKVIVEDETAYPKRGSSGSRHCQCEDRGKLISQVIWHQERAIAYALCLASLAYQHLFRWRCVMRKYAKTKRSVLHGHLPSHLLSKSHLGHTLLRLE